VSSDQLISLDEIESAILVLRGQRVLLAADLARLYNVETKVLTQAVKRNLERFPTDFMFQLDEAEWLRLRSRTVASNRGGTRYLPFAFTEQGVAMLSSVPRSPRAIQVNIEIMRAFVRLRRMLSETQVLADRLDQLEQQYDEQFKVVFDALRQRMNPPEKKRRPTGLIAMDEASKENTP
jgi:hypothetical protein